MSVAALEASAERLTTPCGEGEMVWRRWGSGPVLVLLHGGSGSWKHWARNIGHFAKTRTVLAADTPGLGESERPPGEAHPSSIALVMAEGLARILGPERLYDLVGFSFGANCAAHLAAIEGAHVRTLTIVGAPSLGLPRQPTELVKVRNKQGEERREANRTNLERLMFHDPALIDDEALDIQEWNTVHARLVSKGLASGTSLKDQLPKIVAPVRAIWGGRDVVAYPYIEERLEVLREARPELKSRVIDGSGHWVMYETPEAFNAALEEML
jgi:pimeloyl-ACP methyl ester carboxylesterase